jgi:pyruvate,water dikinase
MTGSVILRSYEAHDVAVVGGKAAALSKLAAHGFDVPPFFVLTEAAFKRKGLAAEARDSLAGVLGEIGPGPFATRSSAREEDGDSHSHAGQFLSILDVPESRLASAAHKVWMSGAASSVQQYRETRGLDRDGGKPAVLVQRMVNARAAGVCFTADPVSGRRGRIVISAIAGLGDRLVGGEEDGQTYVLSATTRTVLERPDADAVLTDTNLAALADLAIRVEQVQGSPQDIEWAFEGERLFLLQSRPITTPLAEAPAPDTAVTIFDNSNIVESYPGLVSPLTYSFAQYAYARVYRTFVSMIGVSQQRIRANAAVFDNMLGRIDGRVYYNLINWYRALALLPGFANNRAHMETMMGVGAPLPAEIAGRLAPPPAHGLERLTEYARIGKMAACLLFEAARLPFTRAAFFRRLSTAVTADPAAIRAMPLTALAAEYRRIEADLLDRWDAPLINDFLCMIAFGGSRKLIEKWAGPVGLELHNAVMIGQGDIISAEPAKRIASMAALARGDDALIARLERTDPTLLANASALAAELKAYLSKFGDRCTEELKLESITLDEDPAQLLMAVAAAARSPANSKPAHAPDSSAELAALFKNARIKGWLMGRIMVYAKARVRDRENLRFERTRIFGQARRVLLAMGAQLHAYGAIEAPRDVFMLTVQEVLGAIEGFAVSGELRTIVAMRRKEMEVAATLPEPPERITMTGAAVTRQRAAVKVELTAGAGEQQRSATGCSAGKLRGVARVITDPRRQALAKGEILIARHTDPGWIAVFSNAAAMVVERGSLLSHSAIVAREMGIPCVVGLKDATRWIADGEIIEVDGGAGTVRKVDG